jgi:SAM-dependent methyltransferase
MSVVAADLTAFGHRRYLPAEVLADKVLAEVLRPTFLTICRELGLKDGDASRLGQQIWAGSTRASTTDLEMELRRSFAAILDPTHLRAAFDRRANKIIEQIAPYLTGSSVADIGCGDGMVAWGLRDQFTRIMLFDVHSYLDARVQRPLLLYAEGKTLPMDEMVDSSLLLTVLHHYWDPLHLLRETRRVTRNRALVIESVFGVVPATGCPLSTLYLLDRERQRMYATFVDWFYNRILRDGIPVPYNFSTPAEWPHIFGRTGWSVRNSIDLGIDQPIVPEHHILYVLEPA